MTVDQVRTRCPICGKPVQDESRPFCSDRCKAVDLGRWLDGAYRLPGEEIPAEAEIIEFARYREREN